MLTRYLFFALLLFSALMSACAPVGERLVGEPVSRAFADELMLGWYESSARVVSIQGLAKVKVKTPVNSLNGTQVLLAERPASLRAEALSPFGSPLLLLAAEDGKLGVSLPSQNLFYTGAATPENLGLFVHIPLQLTDLVGVLLYQPPIIDAWREEAFAFQDGGWLVKRHGTLHRQELVFNQLRQLVEVRYFEKNDLFIRIEYAKFLGPGDSFPHRFSLDIPEKGATINLEFSDLETNGDLRAGIFQLSPPPGAEVVYLPDVFLPEQSSTNE